MACLNYYYTADKDGNLHYVGDEHAVMIGFNKNFNTKLLEEKIKEQYTKLLKSRSYQDLSDYCVMLMKLGKNDVALPVLKVLYAYHPDEFQLASNLGTSYELAGEVDSALKYIKRGIELNPHDHEGSEWIHVKVLEAKLKLLADSNYLATHTVLELTPEQEYDTLIGYQIEIQVRERFPFCPGPDLIMSSLLTDLADITLNTRSVEDAKTYYNICRYYFLDSSETVESKIAESLKQIAKNSNVRPPRDQPGTEGDNVRLGPYKYTEMLDDNNPDGYQPKWSNLNINPAELLFLLGMKIPAPVPDKADTASGAPVQPENHNALWAWIGIFVFFASIYGYVLMKKR